MRQYMDMKRQHPDEILLFRMGDFYETFLDDARTVSKVLGIALTARSKESKTGEKIPLAGFPWHALDGYLTRLIRAGYRVAICEQVEDPAKAKGLVKREVVEVITPGTLVCGSALEERVTLLLCSAFTRDGLAGIAFCDLSTGEISATEVDSAQLDSELARRSPRELLRMSADVCETPEGCSLTVLEDWKFDNDLAEETVKDLLGVASLDGLDLAGRTSVVSALGAMLQYVAETKKAAVTHLFWSGFYLRNTSMIIDRTSARALGITESMPGEEAAILSRATDETVTPAGARTWREWLLSPPRSSEAILSRLDAVEELSLDSSRLGELRKHLGDCSDLLRQSGRLGTLKSGPRDLMAIANTASLLPVIASRICGCSSEILQGVTVMDTLTDLAGVIRDTLEDEPPLKIVDGRVIRQGFSRELDELREVQAGGKAWIASLVEREREATGIAKLTVGYNRVFGYYIEVSKSNLDKVPERFVRKQTLVGGERFITPDLKEYESKILRADSEIVILEQKLFAELRSGIAQDIPRIRSAGETLATLDVIASLAFIALERGYVRPKLETGPCLEISGGRHPVLEQSLPAGECVPNDLNLDSGRRILIVTGPNMAGKSTYLRQIALLVVLAQTGSFVPAESMTFSPVDRLFTRIGSADHILRGQSTFLVEMAETSLLLNSCTRHSLAILDEVGRGTSTFDGLSIAWAMVEYLHENPEHRPLVLFATHYHELTALGSRLAAAANVNILVRETGNRIVFLYRVEDGSTDRSYGIHVASMAGMPKSVLKRAKQVLTDLETGRHIMPGAGISDQLELPLSTPEHPVIEDIRALDPDSISPKKALELIYELREKLE